MEKFSAVVGGIHQLTKKQSPTRDVALNKKLAAMRNRHTVEGAKHVNVLDALPALFGAIMGRKLSNFENVRDWTSMLHAFVYFARPCEITEYCTEVQNVTMPPKGPSTAGLHAADGFPAYLEIRLDAWKGTDADSPMKYSILLWRNRVDVRFCPVYWTLFLMRLLKECGITQGPLFPRFDETTGKPFIAHKRHCVFDNEANRWLWFGEPSSPPTEAASSSASSSYAASASPTDALQDGQYRIRGGGLLHAERINQDVHQWCTMVTKAFDAAGFHGATAYSIRKSGCVWAARCGAKTWQLKNAGRWCHGSTSYDVYIVAGINTSELATREGAEDPIRKMWVWHPTSVLQDLHKDLQRSNR